MAQDFDLEKSIEFAKKLEAAKKQAMSVKKDDFKKIGSDEVSFNPINLDPEIYKKGNKELKKKYTFNLRPSIKEKVEIAANSLNMGISEFVEFVLEKATNEKEESDE